MYKMSLDTLARFDSQSNYIMNELYTSFEDAVFIIMGAGAFDNATTRYTMSSTSTTWMIHSKNSLVNVDQRF